MLFALLAVWETVSKARWPTHRLPLAPSAERNERNREGEDKAKGFLMFFQNFSSATHHQALSFSVIQK